MRWLADTIQKAREGAGLSKPMMARLLGIEVSHLERLEDDQAEVAVEVLDRYAQTFGLSLERFMAGEAKQTPAALLFRSMSESTPSLEELAATETHLVLGEFLRCV